MVSLETLLFTYGPLGLWIAWDRVTESKYHEKMLDKLDLIIAKIEKKEIKN
jgi:hypothetical protein